jgi:glyoxylase-like metal-dependent hydrolase (beta-lactamase superfamily II)
MANVLATGDLFTPGHFPIIDTENGGSIQGVIQALNHILELSASAKDGTQIVPGHGPLSDAAALLEYRDMLIILRDRIQSAINKGHAWMEVRNEGLTRDYDSRYGAATGPWATDKFMEAVFNSLKTAAANSNQH